MKLRVGKNLRTGKTSSRQNGSNKKMVALGLLVGAFFVFVAALYLIGENDSMAPDRHFIVTVDPVKKVVYGETEKVVESSNPFLREVAGKVYEILSDGISSVASLANPSIKHVRIHAGMRKEEIADILAKKLEWDLSEEINFMTSRNELALADINSGEGYYFPGGYSFQTDATPTEVATTIISKFNEEVTSQFASSTKSVISLETALKIASIIERESNGKKDMRLISGIIWNRIFNGMSLDMDATLQYAKGTEKIGWWPKVVPSDKYIDSPYNTYQNKGLPPSPISSPSIAAIQAALNPKKTECLFYLHDKRRNIHCSVTYQQHVANIRRYY